MGNPNSGDTGGLLQSDWTTEESGKLEALDLLQPFPSKIEWDSDSNTVCISFDGELNLSPSTTNGTLIDSTTTTESTTKTTEDEVSSTTMTTETTADLSTSTTTTTESATTESVSLEPTERSSGYRINIFDVFLVV